MRRISLIILVLILCAIGLREVSRSTTWQIMGDLIHHGDRNQKVIALTFDDGPTAKYTAEILEILKAHQVPATFFLIGKFVDERPQSVAQIAQHGHEIGNHSYSHKCMALRTPAWIRTELIKTDQAMTVRSTCRAKVKATRLPMLSSFPRVCLSLFR